MTSYRLKLIAIVTMTIDHFAKILGQRTLLVFFPGANQATNDILFIMEWIGRIAFPLFAFMIAEGCAKTKSMPKYIGRLSLFAVISQPFYYLSLSHRLNGTYTPDNISQAFRSFLTLNGTNVFVTLALGVACVYVYQRLCEQARKGLRWLILPVLLTVCFLAQFILNADYGAFGVLLVAVLYFFRSKPAKAIAILVWSASLYMLYASWDNGSLRWLSSNMSINLVYILPFVFSCAAIPLILAYNGQRGRKSKWVFYIFYPTHLAVIAGIKTAAWYFMG